MFKRLLSKKKSVIFTWLLSYIIVLLTPIVISGIIYIQTEKVIENESMRANNGILLQAKERMDALISEVKRLSTDMVFNTRVQELTRAKKPLNDASKYTVYKINQDLKAYGVANKSIDEFYIYFKNIDMVLSSSFNSDSNTFFKIKHETDTLNFERWKEINSRTFLGEYIPLVRKTDSGTLKKSIAYIQTVPAAGGYAETATAVVLFDEDRIYEHLKNFDLSQNGTFLILNKNNNVLYKTSKIKLNENITYEKLDQSQDVIYEELDGEKFVISYVTSEYTSWKYMAIVPVSVFWGKIQYVSKLTKISVIICLCLGGILIYFLLKRNYNPMDKLVRLFQNKLEVDFEEDSSEYSFLERAATINMAEKEKIKSKLEQQNSMLKSTYLARLLKGTDNGGLVSLQEFMKTFGLQLRSESFGVMLFYIEDVEELFSMEKDLDFAQRFKLLQFIITNVVEELAGQKNIGMIVEIDNMMACIINFNDAENQENSEEMVRVAREAQQFISEQFQIHITIAISNIVEPTTAIPQAYQQALQAMEYKLVVGMDEIIHFKDIQKPVNNYYYYPLDKEQQLVNYIKLGDFPKVKIILDEVFRINFKEQLISIDLAKCLVFNLISTMINTVNEISGVVDNEFLKTLNPVERLLHDETVDDIQDHITEILRQVCEYIVQKNDTARDDIKAGAVEYIQNNYHDKNLSITMVADQFKMTGPYVSKLFKEQTGEALVDYINKFRIEKAKELMQKDNSLNLEQVADQVGYSSIRTFSRYFNKYIGMSPGKYKELNIQQK